MGFGGWRSSLGVMQVVLGAVFLLGAVVYGKVSDETQEEADALSIGEETVPQEIRKLISILMGMASTILWMIVGFPQFYENYKNQSGEALSVFFVLVWWSGDVLYLSGCYLTEQIPSVKLVGFWYLIMDSIFLWQMFYYDVLKKSSFWCWATNNPEETEPLIKKKVYSPQSPQTQNININVTSADSRSCESASGSYGRWATSPPVASPLSPHPHLSPSLPPTSSSPSHPSPKRLFILLPFALFVIVAPTAWVGVCGSFGSVNEVGVVGTGRSLLEIDEDGHENSILCLADTCDEGWQCVVGNGLAWASSAFFLVSRIPQIIKNFQRKSCEGLSMLMFTFAVLGNLTLAISIFIICIEPAYLEMEAPYLVGALGTLVMDFMIFGQFLVYKKEEVYEPVEDWSKPEKA